MTRRERHIRIIESWGNFRYSHQVRFCFQELMSRRGLAALTDEAVRELATDLVVSQRRHNRMNAENRKRAAARA